MADSTLDSNMLMLFDRWPDATPILGASTSFFTNTTDHNVASATYKEGTKWMVFNDGTVAGVSGWSTFIYLKFLAVTAANPTPAAKQFVIPSLAGTPFQVTNDPDQALDVTGSSLAAVLISAMSFDDSDAFFGFAWCGGVCPEQFVSGLGGSYATTNDVAIGPVAISDLSVDAIGLSAVGGDTEAVIGFSYSDDAA